MTQSKQIGERKHMKKTPKRKTSVYLDEQNIPKIQKFQRQYNLSLNRVVNICLTKYLDEMRVWIWCYGTRNPSAAHRRPVDHSECRGFESRIMWFYWWQWTQTEDRNREDVREESPIAGNQPRSIQKIPVMPRFAKKPHFFAFPHNSLKILMKLFDFLWGFLYNAKCNHQ